MDGTLVETTEQCKQGMDIAYNGTWAHHLLELSLGETCGTGCADLSRLHKDI
jgi:hypothetical protein